LFAGGEAMEVRVVHQESAQSCPATDFVRVSTCSDPNDDTVTLATIQRVVEKKDAKKIGHRWHVKTLIMERPMSPDEALGFATRYAARKQIPVVCTEFQSPLETAPAKSEP
jgi:hypothetical protein